MKTNAGSLSVDFLCMINMVESPLQCALCLKHHLWIIFQTDQIREFRNSLKSSGTEMSLSTSNILWHLVQKHRPVPVKLHFKSISQWEHVAKDNLNTLKRHTVNWEFHYLCICFQFLVCLQLRVGVVSVRSSLVHYICLQVIQQNEWEADICVSLLLNWPSSRRWYRPMIKIWSFHCCCVAVF